MSVYLVCLKEGSRLRVRITTPGYLSTANCQFPRALRVEGRMFKVSPSAVHLAAGPRGKYFYRVNGPVEVLGASSEAEVATPQTVSLEHVYDDGGDCVVCLDAPKTRIMVPCGHFCLCDACNAQLRKRACPICRSGIALAITPEQMG